jgi:phosphatidylserine decarboxylase
LSLYSTASSSKLNLWTIQSIKYVFSYNATTEAQDSSPKIKDFDDFCTRLQGIVESAPTFIKGLADENQPVAVPLLTILDGPSNTAAAADLFCRPGFNRALERLLQRWHEYLQTDSSGYVLDDKPTHWFSPDALDVLEKDRGKFEKTYCLPNDNPKEGFGLKTWDEFFTREVLPDARPVVHQGDPAYINNACESTYLDITEDVKKHDRFWVKAQNYSLFDMLAYDQKRADYFVGGTVYQAFLSPADYHRWRSPVKGTIEEVKIVQGTYYAVLPEDPHDESPGSFEDGRGALVVSQKWLTTSATRALIYIRTEEIGVVCFMAIGMAEVSSCDVRVRAKDSVDKGSLLGMFHFGGSSHALIFNKDVKLEFRPDLVKEDGNANHIKVNDCLAKVTNIDPRNQAR